ncbi:hypothetical protein AbHV_ORF27 [Abalone herpesvirus Victoria/AUS/2009]|uniref:Uncharacterized protein n=1 Tax=Abalone herpesvirus (isolate Abalone/Australia/Victoria/2009) TaxID=1241371 RepID=K4K8G6_ABHV|nr:hypothetical protein AbHV_ORF27 [Abalone herpesvirus Victoria/AUS/2009]AFU90037.1 hypothetical protein AbHV_ORF27 [Abalone herpesvirus Victoria/AUS/2009]
MSSYVPNAGTPHTIDGFTQVETGKTKVTVKDLVFQLRPEDMDDDPNLDNFSEHVVNFFPKKLFSHYVTQCGVVVIMHRHDATKISLNSGMYTLKKNLRLKRTPLRVLGKKPVGDNIMKGIILTSTTVIYNTFPKIYVDSLKSEIQQQIRKRARNARLNDTVNNLDSTDLENGEFTVEEVARAHASSRVLERHSREKAKLSLPHPKTKILEFGLRERKSDFAELTLVPGTQTFIDLMNILVMHKKHHLWIYSVVGNYGKSYAMEDLCNTTCAQFVRDFRNATDLIPGVKVLIYDDLERNQLSFTDLKRITSDSSGGSINCKTFGASYAIENGTSLIVTSNKSPYEVYAKQNGRISEDMAALLDLRFHTFRLDDRGTVENDRRTYVEKMYNLFDWRGKIGDGLKFFIKDYPEDTRRDSKFLLKATTTAIDLMKNKCSTTTVTEDNLVDLLTAEVGKQYEMQFRLALNKLAEKRDFNLRDAAYVPIKSKYKYDQALTEAMHTIHLSFDGDCGNKDRNMVCEAIDEILEARTLPLQVVNEMERVKVLYKAGEKPDTELMRAQHRHKVLEEIDTPDSIEELMSDNKDADFFAKKTEKMIQTVLKEVDDVQSYKDKIQTILSQVLSVSTTTDVPDVKTEQEKELEDLMTKEYDDQLITETNILPETKIAIVQPIYQPPTTPPPTTTSRKRSRCDTSSDEDEPVCPPPKKVCLEEEEEEEEEEDGFTEVPTIDEYLAMCDAKTFNRRE